MHRHQATSGKYSQFISLLFTKTLKSQQGLWRWDGPSHRTAGMHHQPPTESQHPQELHQCRRNGWSAGGGWLSRNRPRRGP